MRASVLVYLIGFVLILLLLFLVGRALLVTDYPARVVDLAGTAELQSRGKGAWKPVSAGQILKAGDVVRTGADSEVDLAWVNKTHVRLAPNSVLQLRTSKIRSSNRSVTAEMKLSAGRAWFSLPKQRPRGSVFEVRTPTITAGVYGTIFSLDVAQDKAVKVEVYSGTVYVTRGKEATTVGRRQTAVFSSKGALSKATRMTGEERRAWEEKRSVTGAFLSVVQPQEGARVSSSTLTVSGFADPGDAIQVNGQNASINDEGAWFSQAILKRGENLLTVSATDSDGRMNTIVRKVTY